jgi:hypothetical protein
VDIFDLSGFDNAAIPAICATGMIAFRVNMPTELIG